MSLEGSTMHCHCCAAGAPSTGPAVGGYFLLDDQEGRRADAFSFGDRLLLLFFGFTHCKVVCPRELDKIEAALDDLAGLANRIQPLYVSIDPERDSPAVMKSYLAARPRIVGLTGSRAEIDDIKRSFRVYAERRDDPLADGGYVVPHTTIAYLARPGGQVLAHFPDSIASATLAERLRGHLAGPL